MRWLEGARREQSEAMSWLPLCRWNVRVAEGFCASETAGPLTQSAQGVRGWTVHTLNRLGATAAFLQEWGNAFWANSGMSLRAWRVSEWGGRCRHVFMQPLLSWVAPDEEGWFFFSPLFFGLFGAHTHTRGQKSLADTFPRGSHALWCNYSTDEWAKAGTFHSLWCVFVFVFVCK